jgi:hypothetical protein
MARVACALWGVATAPAAVLVVLGAVAPAYLQRIGL